MNSTSPNRTTALFTLSPQPSTSTPGATGGLSASALSTLSVTCPSLLRGLGTQHSALGTLHRRGSMMIIVVAVLVMLALMATAYISTARMDRQAAALVPQSAPLNPAGGAVNDAKLDALLKTVTNAVEKTVFEDVATWQAGSGGYYEYRRVNSTADSHKLVDALSAPLSIITTPLPPVSITDPATDGSTTPARIINSDPWIASRLPISTAEAGLAGGSTTIPVWPLVSYLPWSTDVSAARRQFVFLESTTQTDYSRRSNLVPTSRTIGYNSDPVLPPVLRNRRRIYPAFSFNANGTNPFIAADADGDGIADSRLLYFQPYDPNNANPNPPVPNLYDEKVTSDDGTTLGTISYWYAVRIIDNNSAINLNTAWSRDYDYAFNGSVLRNHGMFRSNVGLLELIDPPGTNVYKVVTPDASGGESEMQALNRYRFLRSTAAASTALTETPAASSATFISQGDAIEMQLARRLDNPGYYNTTDRYRAFDESESAVLAYRFCMARPDPQRSAVEAVLGNTAWTWAPNGAWNSDNRLPFYPANEAVRWYVQNFYFGECNTAANQIVSARTTKAGSTYPGNNNYPPLRALLTTRNPVSNTTQLHEMNALRTAQPAIVATIPNSTTSSTATDRNRMPFFTQAENTANRPFQPKAGKANINTAPFGELWRAFWNVMVEDTASPMAPFNASVTGTCQFRPEAVTGRSSITGWTSTQQMLVRAALASINAIDLRDSDTNVTSTDFQLSVGGTTYTVYVYGSEKQPYITETMISYRVPAPPATGGVYPNTLANPANDTYVAIELYNPHSQPFNLSGYKLAVYNPATGSLTTCHTFTGTIPAGGFYIVESSTANRHPGINITGTAVQASVTSGTTTLRTVANNPGLEIVLTRSSVGLPGITTAPGGDAPLDQVDLKGAHYDGASLGTYNPGINPPPVPPIAFVRWRYARPVEPWRFIYPGRYDSGVAQRTRCLVRDITTNIAGTGTMNLTGDLGGTSTAPTQTATDPYQKFTIQHCRENWPGPNPNYTRFPFAGFARNGDVLIVPFIGGYKITTGGTIKVLNSVTMDSAFAESTTTFTSSTHDFESRQIGRFCPRPRKPGVSGPSSVKEYDFASRLFDYVTAVSVPHDDHLPNADPYKTSTAKTPNAIRSSLANQGEDHLGVEGLININTAPWQVLAALPYVSRETIPSGSVLKMHDICRMIAKSIVRYREKHGAFRSIFDLRDVPILDYSTKEYPNDTTDIYKVGATDVYFRDIWWAFAATTPFDPTPIHGELSPLPPGVGAATYAFPGAPNDTAGMNPDTIRDDFEEQYLALTRISNLVTTRSDSFTCYVLVQAWLNAGGSMPALLSERRSAFILDRSQINRFNNVPAKLRSLPVPTE